MGRQQVGAALPATTAGVEYIELAELEEPLLEAFTP